VLLVCVNCRVQFDYIFGFAVCYFPLMVMFHSIGVLIYFCVILVLKTKSWFHRNGIVYITGSMCAHVGGQVWSYTHHNSVSLMRMTEPISADLADDVTHQ